MRDGSGRIVFDGFCCCKDARTYTMYLYSQYRLQPPGITYFVIWVMLTQTIFQATGNVAIYPPYYPALYVKVGDDFNITCMSNNVKLSWSRETQASQQETTDTGTSYIHPELGGDFETTWIEKKPSGDVSSVLVKKAAGISDSGTYTCHDDHNSYFSIKVTVLYVWMEIGKSHMLDISCYIAGFSSNLPDIGHRWRVNGDNIAVNSTGYNMTQRDEFMSLSKTHPVREDSNTYACIYTLPTNVDVISISVSHYFDASAFEPSGGKAPSVSSWYTIIIIAILISIYKH